MKVRDLVSIIVLNWNGKNHTPACLDSLLAQTYPFREIVVVDNGSKDGSLEALKEHYVGTVRLIENPKNLGFAEGVNRGLSECRGEFIALLNNDAVVEAAWLEEMVKALKPATSAGMCACKIYLAGRENTLDNTGELICRDGLGKGRGRLELDRGQYDQAPPLCPS